MAATVVTNEPRSLDGTVPSGFTVDVVDGDGAEVPWEPVTARFVHADGTAREATRITDSWGRAQFDVEPGSPAVTVRAGRESVLAASVDAGAVLVIEM